MIRLDDYRAPHPQRAWRLRVMLFLRKTAEHEAAMRTADVQRKLRRCHADRELRAKVIARARAQGNP